MRKLVSEQVCVRCNVVQADVAYQLGVLNLDISSLLHRAQMPMEREVQWLGGTYHLVQHSSSRLLARVRLKVALRFRTSVVPLPLAIDHPPLHVVQPHTHLRGVHCSKDFETSARDTSVSDDAGHLRDTSIKSLSQMVTACTIRIERACDLACDEHANEPDTFVTCNLGESAGTLTTALVRGNCNPRWHHTQQVMLETELLHELPSRALVFEVWRHAAVHSGVQGGVDERASMPCSMHAPCVEGADAVEEGGKEEEKEEDACQARCQLVGRATVDLFQMQRGGAGIDGWYHVLLHDNSAAPLGAIKIAVTKHDTGADMDSALDLAQSRTNRACQESGWMPGPTEGQWMDPALTLSAMSASAITMASISITSILPLAGTENCGESGGSKVWGGWVPDDEQGVSSQELRDSLRRNMLELDHIQHRLLGLHEAPLALQEPLAHEEAIAHDPLLSVPLPHSDRCHPIDCSPSARQEHSNTSRTCMSSNGQHRVSDANEHEGTTHMDDTNTQGRGDIMSVSPREQDWWRRDAREHHVTRSEIHHLSRSSIPSILHNAGDLQEEMQSETNASDARDESHLTDQGEYQSRAGWQELKEVARASEVKAHTTRASCLPEAHRSNIMASVCQLSSLFEPQST